MTVFAAPLSLLPGAVLLATGGPGGGDVLYARRHQSMRWVAALRGWVGMSCGALWRVDVLADAAGTPLLWQHCPGHEGLL